jgi:CBS domain-containing protein
MLKQGPTVQQAKRYGIYRCFDSETLKTAAQRMVDEDVSCLAVVDSEGYLVGIVTRVDLLRAYVNNHDWADQHVSNVMIRDVITVKPEDMLYHVAELLITRGIHRVVVVNDEDGRQKPVAVVSAADLVYHMLKSTS